MTTMLASFNITKAKDENGKEIDINPVWTDSGLVLVAFAHFYL